MGGGMGGAGGGGYGGVAGVAIPATGRDAPGGLSPSTFPNATSFGLGLGPYSGATTDRRYDPAWNDPNYFFGPGGFGGGTDIAASVDENGRPVAGRHLTYQAAPGQRLDFVDRGSRTVGSTNWNAVGNISNYLSQLQGTPQYDQAAAFLRSQGMMPSYNGVPLDQWMTSGGIRNPYGDFAAAGPVTRQGPTGASAAPASQRLAGMGGDYSNAPSLPRSSVDLSGTVWGPIQAAQNRSAGYTVGGGSAGGGTLGAGLGVPAAGWDGASVAATPSPLESGLQSTYARLLKSGGSVLGPDIEQAQASRLQSGYARAGQDAIEAARLDAIRRGDTSGSSLGDVEARIRMQSADAGSRARLDLEAQQREANMRNLLAASSGAGGLLGQQFGRDADLRRLAIMLGALQQGGQTGALNFMVG